MSIARSYQPAFAAGELSPALGGRIDWEKYEIGAQRLQNVVVRKEGGVTKAPGTRFIADCGVDGEPALAGPYDNKGQVRLIPFVFSISQSYVLELTNKRLRVLTAEGLVLKSNGQPVSLTTPYAVDELFALSYAQSADVLYLAHQSHAPYKLMRRGHDEWELAKVSFLPKTQTPKGVTAGFTEYEITKSRVWRYRVTAIDEASGEESLPSAVVEVLGSESMRVGILQNGVPLKDWFATVSWNLVTGANEYRVYKETSEGSGMYGYIGSAAGNSFTDRNIAVNAEDGPPVGYNPFAAGNSPACVGIHQQRLLFANSAAQPATIWMSRTGNYENFTKSARTKADDHIEATLSTRQMNPIVWLADQRALIAGTTGAEWELKGANGALAPGQVDARPQSSRGSAPGLFPVVVGNSLLHVTRNGDSVRDLQYTYSSDSYGGSERSLFATHLFADRRVTDMSYQESPNSVVWCVMNDGMLLGLTWLEEQNIFAWHRHITDGFYEGCCTIPQQGEDQAFFVVRRVIDGVHKRYIEKLEPAFIVPDDYRKMSSGQLSGVLSRAFFVHSGLSYEGTPRQEFGGLSHLEGKTVAVLYDGAVHPPLLVRDGVIKLRRAASVVHVGLPYEAAVETVNFEPTQQYGVSVGRPKRIAKVVLKVEAASMIRVGVNGETVEPKWRSDEPYGTPPKLRGGALDVVVPGYCDQECSVWVTSSEPVPFSVLSISPDVSVPA